MGRTERNGHEGSLRIAGRYRLVEKLGTGGMSVVWRAYDETLSRDVAVKVLTPQLATDRAFRDRLRQEALAAARLCHPHITGVYDFGEALLSDHLTVPYVVMELNDGESVGARIGRQGTLDWREAVMVCAEVASALATAHARGVVHRDVTPANVMLTGAGAKVVDFGISAVVGQRDAGPDGSLLGTPAYLAPERLGGAPVSPATDVYALGLLLYRALTGRMPWPAASTTEALRAHLYADPDPVPDVPGMPAAVADLCLRCLAKAPADRPVSAEVARALAATVGVRPIIPPLRPGERPAVPVARAVVPAPAGSEAPRRARLSWLSGSPHRRLRRPAAPHGASGRSGSSYGSVAESGPGLPDRRPWSSGPSCRLRLRELRLRAALRFGTVLRTGAVHPLGNGLFLGSRLRQAGAVAAWVRHGRPARARNRLSAAAALATVVLLAGSALTWSARREAADADQSSASAAGPGADTTQRVRCSVQYQVRRDSGGAFEARMTVLTTGGSAGWRLEFSFPGTQRLAGPPRSVAQHGRRVVVRGAGRSRVITLRGGYRDRNPLPLAFAMNGHPCRAEVLGVVSDPATKDDAVSAASAKDDRPGPEETIHQRKRPPSRHGGARRKAAPSPADPSPAAPAKPNSGFSLAL
ncbi:serine/threonine protein kinase [Actinoplanes sp. SE50]|uniref:serine/threonine-protein kinase n=1 Tax=unclassified Actinoplanes TaxID=2626549 RepID=UPI00023ECFAE|nr:MULTISPECIES: serine/threonine-protein kinase [unclassified Actinoplanes]AEV81602.1 serine/threonine protein kinase, bacterial [Actinoplanes sp. SE50/110]ATO80003.1 serine/threonine protein kinase [Actinoplanes sp. SE50]SLL97407.1 serine/threonine protein kinase [Actinoplanes sp. SE50/110]